MSVTYTYKEFEVEITTKQNASGQFESTPTIVAPGRGATVLDTVTTDTVDDAIAKAKEKAEHRIDHPPKPIASN